MSVLIRLHFRPLASSSVFQYPSHPHGSAERRQSTPTCAWKSALSPPIPLRLICIEEGVILLQIHANDQRKQVSTQKGVNKWNSLGVCRCLSIYLTLSAMKVLHVGSLRSLGPANNLASFNPHHWFVQDNPDPCRNFAHCVQRPCIWLHWCLSGTTAEALRSWKCVPIHICRFCHFLM